MSMGLGCLIFASVCFVHCCICTFPHYLKASLNLSVIGKMKRTNLRKKRNNVYWVSYMFFLCSCLLFCYMCYMVFSICLVLLLLLIFLCDSCFSWRWREVCRPLLLSFPCVASGCDTSRAFGSEKNKKMLFKIKGMRTNLPNRDKKQQNNKSVPLIRKKQRKDAV